MRFITLLCAALFAAAPALADWTYSTVAGEGGVPLNVATAGDPSKPGILFVHGIGQSHYSFKRQLDSALASDFYLVAYDLRGHGGSGKPWTEADYAAKAWAGDLRAVMAATGLDKPLLVAWSYGTSIALDYLRLEGEGGVSGLLLTGAHGGVLPFRMPPADDPKSIEFAQLRVLQMSSSPADNVHVADRMVDWLTATPLDADDREVFRGVSLMLPVYARRAMLSRRLDNQDMADRLALPLLFSLGSADAAPYLDEVAAYAERRDNVELSVYEGGGHTVFYEQPERFNRELREFAQRVLAP